MRHFTLWRDESKLENSNDFLLTSTIGFLVFVLKVFFTSDTLAKEAPQKKSWKGIFFCFLRFCFLFFSFFFEDKILLEKWQSKSWKLSCDDCFSVCFHKKINHGKSTVLISLLNTQHSLTERMLCKLFLVENFPTWGLLWGI